MHSELFTKIQRLTTEKYIFWTTLSVYLALLIINPSKYIILLSFVILIFLYYLRINNLAESLFFAYISSLVILTGKEYTTQLLPAGFFPKEIYPLGYFADITITCTHFISFAMLLFIARGTISKLHSIKLSLADILLLLFYTLKVLSAFLGSKNVSFSLPFEILSLTNLIAYFYAKMYIKPSRSLWKNVSYLIGAIVIFESILGFGQLANKSPLGRNIESLTSLGYFGHTVDEVEFTFRPHGTFGHANILGIWTASVCIILFGFSLTYKSNYLWFSFFSGLALMIATISRSAWLGFGIGLLFIVVYLFKSQKETLKPLFTFLLKWRFLIIPVLLLLFLFFVVPRAYSSLYSFQADTGGFFFRKIQILDAVEMITLHPIFGIGAFMGVYEGISLNLHTMAALTPFDVHTWYLATAVQNGLPACFILILFLIISTRRIFELDGRNIIYVSIVASIFCLSIAAILQPYINIEFVLLLLSLIKYDSIGSTNDAKVIKTPEKYY
jgi:hypothetical protein